MIQILGVILALVVGAAVGLGFGAVQAAAQRRNQKRQERGGLNSGWAVMPGSGRRVAYFVVALALIQVVCPMLFQNGIQWWVSGGVVLGYGYSLYTQMSQRLWGKK
jgi:hypothetical protein